MKFENQFIPAEAPTLSPCELRTALRWATSVTARRDIIPALSTVRMIRKGCHLSLTATDLDRELTLTLPCSGEDLGILICPRLLSKIIRGAKHVEVSPRAEGGLTLNADDMTVQVGEVLPVADFPDFALTEPTASAVLPEGILHDALRSVQHCISTDGTRYYLNGIYLHGTPSPDGGATLRSVATNGHVMAICDTGATWCLPAATFPTPAVATLLTLTRPGGNHPVRITAYQEKPGTAPKLVFEGDGWIFKAKTIDGTYPDYTRVIPSIEAPAETQATLSREGLRRLPIGHDNALTIDPNAGTASTHSICGAFTASIPVSARGSKPFRFNIFYLRAFADASPDGLLRIEANSGIDPFRVITSDPRMTNIVMPMTVYS